MGSHRSRAAHAVFCDAALVPYITAFQRGLPRDIIAFAQAHGYPQKKKKKSIPHAVARYGSLRMLQRLYELQQAQPVYFADSSMLNFDGAWLGALRGARLDTARWLETIRGLVPRPGVVSQVETTTTAFKSGSVEAIEWVYTHHPELMGPVIVNWTAVAARGYVDLFRWLEVHGHVVEQTTDLLDAAAMHGHLPMVQYLHEHRTEGCTTNAIDGAAAMGHLEVVRFLHEHRTEGATEKAMYSAVAGGHVDVLRYLHEHYHQFCDHELLFFAEKVGQHQVAKALVAMCASMPPPLLERWLRRAFRRYPDFFVWLRVKLEEGRDKMAEWSDQLAEQEQERNSRR